MKVSVVIPVHNGEKYLAQAIESVLGQTFRDFELLIVDDGSTDGSRAIMDGYARRDARIRILSQENRGVAAAGNRGLEEARTEWVARLDADDIFLPEKLKQQVAFLRRNPEAMIVGTLACFINHAGRPLGLVGTEGPFTVAEYDRLVRENRPIYFVNSSTLMHRETVLSMGGYREAFAPAEDVDLWIRMAEQGHLMLKVPEPLLLYRMHGESLTMTQNAGQRLLHRWAIACGEARVKGLPEPSFGEFMAGEKRRPVAQRIRISRRETGERLYQRAALHYAEQRPLAMIPCLLAAAVIHPAHVIPRLYARKIEPLLNGRTRPGRAAVARQDPAREVSLMRPEIELLLACAAFPSDRTDTLPALPETVDWNRFIGLCEWHNVAPLVYRALPAVCTGTIPPAVMNRLRNLCHNNTARALFLASELSRILNALESCGVPAYPFKGPALSVMLYGDPARRQSKDLDILIPKEALHRAMKVLDAQGYKPQNVLDGARLSAHRRTEYETSFSRRDGKLHVELQWAVVPAYFGFDLERLGIWSRLEPRTWNGHVYPVLPPEETLLMLCVHGAKHLWCKLGWIADVAGLLNSPAPPDLTRTLELAGRCGVMRLLCTGLLLAERLTGAQLPREVSARIDADLMVAVIARQARELIAKSPVNPDIDPARYLFYLKSKDCRLDQLLFAGRLMVTLAAGEWNPSALPDVLSPFYYLFRPLHMAGRHGGPILRAMARK